MADGKPGKPRTGFPPFPPSLEIRNNSGFPHSHSFDNGLFYIKVKPKNLTVRKSAPHAGRCILILGATAAIALAQSSSFGQAAQGIATEMIAIAKWLGIILCIICGIGLMAGGPGTIAKVSGLFLCLIFALFASPIITWVQGL